MAKHLFQIANPARALQFADSRGQRVIRKAHGFALIDMIFVTGVIGLLCCIAMPRLLIAKQSAGAASAIGSMRTVGSAQLSYALTCNGGFYAPSLTRLGTPPPGTTQAFITPGLGGADSVIKSGYTIRMTATPFAGAPSSCNGLAAGGAGQAFVAGADPLEPTNTRFFATNANTIIYEHSSSLYDLMPEVGTPAVGQILR